MVTSVAELEQPSDSGTADAVAQDAVSAVITVIEPKPGWRTIDFGELWQYRELVYFLTWRDIKVRYKQTIMGAAWAILQPLMTSLVFVILFGKMGGMEVDTTVPYLLFVFAAQIAWQYFATSVSQCGQSLVTSANLISKVYFPRLIVPLASVGAGLVDFLVGVGVLVVLMIAYQFVPPVQIVFLPLFLVGVIVSAVGVGSLLAALTVAYRDFRYVVPFLIQMWMFATPVGYPLNKLTNFLESRGYSRTWELLYFANPMAGMTQGFRWSVLGEPLDMTCLAVSAISACLLLVIGATYFRLVERRFADIV
ncbi:MAG: ABC transporter permease [Planctomycetaceae bacterium]